jgi:hypothetical protein
MTTIAIRSPMQTTKSQRFLASAQPALPHHASWTERLAASAERQPNHRRLGCWTVS